MQYEELRKHDLVYLATPYSKYPKGQEMAFRDACALAAKLVRLKVKVYSPIAHAHPIAIHGGIDPLALDLWLDFDAAMMAKSDAILIAQMEGWDRSSGIAHEMQEFRAAGKPIRFVDPVTMGVEHVAMVGPSAVPVDG